MINLLERNYYSILRALLCFLGCLIFLNLSGCNRALDWAGGTSSTISGNVIPFGGLASQGNLAPRALTCQSASARLFSLSTAGEKNANPLQSVAVSADGSYTFSGIRSLGITVRQKTQIEGSYFVEVSGCNTSFGRILTSTNGQDITVGTTLVSYLLNTQEASKVTNANATKLENLYSSLSTFSNFADAYSALVSNPLIASDFTDAFNTAPATLIDASPTVLSIIAPSALREHDVANFSIATTQWDTNYNYAYSWTMDGQEFATTANSFYTPSANFQGSHVLKVSWGQQNNSGILDTSKPFQQKTFSITVENNIPPAPPTVAAASSGVNSPAVSLSIQTGASLLNCESFTGLAITEDMPIAPVSPGSYSLQCSAAPTQNFTYNLQGGIGTHILYLWAMDSSGKTSELPQSLVVDYSLAIPAITIASPLDNAPVQNSVTVSGSCEDSSGDVTFSGGITPASVLASCVSGIYSKQLALSAGDGNKTITASQTNQFETTGSATIHVVKDTVSPTVVIASTSNSITNLSSIPVTITFSENVANFDSTKISATNGSISSFAGAGANYSFIFTPAAQGTVNVDIAAGAVSDAAGNPNLAAPTFSRNFDTSSPTVVLSSAATNPTKLSSIPVTATFSKNVTGFTLGNLSLINATASSLTGSGAVYTFTLIPSGQGSASVAVIANAAQDAAGNGSDASSALSRVYDSVGPTVTLTSTATNPTNLASIPVTAVFSEAVTGFSFSSITATNGTLSGLTGSGTTYSFAVAPIANGVVSLAIASGAGKDAANNDSSSASFSRTFNNTKPTAVLSSSASSPTNLSSIPMSVVFSAPVTGLTLSGISVTNGSASSLTGAGTTYTFTLTPISQGEVTVSVNANAAQDSVTNPSLASNILNLTYDTSAPTVILASAVTSPTNLADIPVSITFSKPVTGFTSAGLQLTNATASISGSGATYLAHVFPSGDGPVSVQVSASSAQDAAGNGNAASSSLSKTYDSTAPTLTLGSAASNPTNATPIPVTAIFSETVSNFSLASVSVTNGSASNLSGSGANYTFEVTPSSNGLVNVSVVPNAAQDAAGNGNTAASIGRTFSNSHPSIILASPLTSPTKISPFPVSATFSAPVTGFNSSGVTVANGAVSGFSSSGNSYSFNVTPSGQGAVDISVASGVAQDSATNTNLASNNLSLIFDTVAPTLSISAPAASSFIGLNNQAAVAISGTCSEEGRQVFISAGSVTSSASCLSGAFNAILNVSALSDGAFTITANLSDQAGNTAAPAAVSVTKDTSLPTAILTGTPSSTSNASSLDITVGGTNVASYQYKFGEASSTDCAVSSGYSSDAAVAVHITGNASALSDGLIKLCAIARNPAGNYQAYSSATIYTWTKDTAVNPFAGLTVNPSSPGLNTKPVVSGVTEGLSAVRLYSQTACAGASIASSTAAADGTFSIAPGSSLGSDGLYNLTILATDPVGNSLCSSPIAYVLDTTAPTLLFTLPPAGSYINVANQNNISFSGSCSEEGQNVTISSGGISTSNACSNGGFSGSLDLHSLADGIVTLTAGTYDQAGNYGSGTVSLTKDATIPTATIAGAPATSSNLTALNLTVGGAGVTAYKYKLGASVDCTLALGYSSEIPVATNITDSISGFSDGLVKVCVVGRSNAGNYQGFLSASSVSWTKDTVVTPFSGLAVSPTSPGNNTKPTVSGTTEGNASVKLYNAVSCSGTFIASDTAGAAGTFSLTPGSSVGGDGAYSFSIKSQDAAGNTLCSNSIAYTLDTAEPTVTLSSTATNFTKISPIPLTATFSESVTGFASSSITATNGTVSGLSGSGASYSFNVIPSGQGAVTVQILAGSAQDAAGNSNLASNTLTRTFDTLAPVLTITSPTANSSISANSVNVVGTCEDGLNIAISGSGVASPASTTCASSAFNVSLNLSGTDGVKNFTLSQTDAAGNLGSVPGSITLDTVAPNLTFASAAIQFQNTSTNYVTFSGACETGLAVVVSGTDSTSVSCTGSSWSYTTTSRTSDSGRAYTFEQTDAAGNQTRINGSWTRDTVAPVLTLTSPAANFAAQTSITLQGACETGLPVIASGTGLLSNVSITCTGSLYSQLVYFSPGDGVKSVTVKQTDAAGNSTPISRSFIRDTTQPALTQTTRSSPYYNNANSATFGGACETGLTVFVTGGTDSSNFACSGGTWSYTTATKTTDASRTYTFTQTDAAGNQGQISATWIRDTVAPALTLTSNANFVTSGNSVTFAGTCESGLSISVSNAQSGTVTCSGGTWSYAATQTTDGNYSYTFSETDLAGNPSSVAGSWTRSTSGPTITITQNPTQVTNGNSLAISGNCSGGTAGSNGIINISLNGSANGTTTCTSNNGTAGTWSYAPTQNSDGTYNYTFSTTDNFSTPRTSTAAISWQRDATPPQITNGSFSIAGGASSTAVSYNPVSFAATDNLSKISKFCLKTTNSAPTASDACWAPLASAGTSPANSISVSNYSYNIGIIPQGYSVYLWVMDGAQNISTNANTAGKDATSITLAPIAPPSVSAVLVSNSDTMNGAASERIIPAGQDVYIRWTASGSSLIPNPITIQFSSDDISWNIITTGLANGQNNCTSMQGAGGASSAATGCYKWNSGSPSSGYYRLRVIAENSLGASSYATGLPLNAGQMQVLAGSTDTGLGSSAASAVFQASYADPNYVDGQSIVVNSKGTIYFRDVSNGIVSIDPSNGKASVIVPPGATTSGFGDGGSILLAKTRFVASIGIDGSDRLILFDYDRIRRVDFSASPPTITTIIGGGASTADTVSTATSLKIGGIANVYGSSNGTKFPLIVLPNGNIYFFAETSGTFNLGKKIRLYNSSTGAISSMYITGSAPVLSNYPSLAVADYSKCGFSSPFVEFDPSSSLVSKFFASLSIGPANGGCLTTAIGSNYYAAFMKFDGVTGGSDTSMLPATYLSVNTNAWQYVSPVQAMDGKIYLSNANDGSIYKFDSDANSYTRLVGAGGTQRGGCIDGTAAASCKMLIGGAFVDARGQIYFVDNGKIRTVVGGVVKTLYGQSLDSPDGTANSNARFGNILSLRQTSDRSIIVGDGAAAKLKYFPRANGTVTTIAGSGNNIGNSNILSPAVSLSIPMRTAFANFFTDSADNIIYNVSGFVPFKLPSTYAITPSTTKWENLKDQSNAVYLSGSTPYYDSTANGAQAGNIALPNIIDTRLVAYNGTSLLTYWNQLSSGITVNTVFAEINMLTGVYTIDLGPGTGTSSSFCADGTSTSTCTSMPVTNKMGSFDAATNRWLVLDIDARSIRSFSSGRTGSIQTFTQLNIPATSFLLKQFSGFNNDSYIYYCGLNDGRVYAKNVRTNSEIALNWPISTISCVGQNLTYDATNDSIVTPFKQNGLTGVVEIFNAHPSSLGI